MAKIKIDEELCIGCGLCAELCPKTFEMKGDKAKVKKAENILPHSFSSRISIFQYI